MIVRVLLYITLASGMVVIPMAIGGCFKSSVDRTDGSRISLAGQWKIMLDDNPEFAASGFDDSSWDAINLPVNLMSYVYNKKPGMSGILWLRKKVRIPSQEPEEDMGLILGRIANADETYFNGIKVGGLGMFPPRAHAMWNHPRYYRISREFIRPGEDNTIAVRVSYYMFGEVLGTLAITGIADWSRSGTLARFLIIELDYIIMALGVILFIIYLFFSFKRPTEQEYIFYCLQILCGFFIVMEVCAYWNLYGSQLKRLQVLVMAWVAVTAVHPLFLHRVYDLDRKKIEAGLWIYFAGAVIFNVFFIHDGMSEEMVLASGATLTIAACLVGMYNISCHISAIIKKHPYAKIFSLFGILAIMGALHDGFIYLMKLTGFDISFLGAAFQYMIFPYAAAVMFIGSALVLTFRFIKMMNEVEDLNTSLESFVIENALLNEKLKISSQRRTRKFPSSQNGDDLKMRLRHVVNFINENYTAHISRTALADRADVHPDSLSRLFKKHTGKKLGDYINELRMKEAADKLVDTDDNITDIAFSVGFDSIRTFNRLFPKFMGMTPERYRRKYREVQQEAIAVD